MNFTLVDWSECEKLWELCAETNTGCGCIGSPTTLMWIIIFIVCLWLYCFWYIYYG